MRVLAGDSAQCLGRLLATLADDLQCSVSLIDNARLLGASDGCPDLAAVRECVLGSRRHWSFESRDDIVLIHALK